MSPVPPIALAALAGQATASPLRSAIGEALPTAWSTAGALLASAGLWALGGAVLGVVVALVITPAAARWTRGGSAAGCLWALLLVTVLGAGGLYGGAVYGVARRSERLVRQEWLLERVTATSVLTIAEESGLDTDAPLSLAPTIARARTQLGSRLGSGALPGAVAMGLGLPRLLGSVLDSVEGLDGLTIADLRPLRLATAEASSSEALEARLSAPARSLLSATGPIRNQAARMIWAAALPHFVLAGLAAAVALGAIFLIGVVSRLVGRRRRPGGPPDAATE